MIPRQGQMALLRAALARSLVDAFMIRQLPPRHANIRKRQVKAPKIYVRDSGLLRQLLGIGSEKGLLSHPKLGASWEGFVMGAETLTMRHTGLGKAAS